MLPPSDLPIEDVIPQIVAELRERTRLVISAPPGAGKTTRVPLTLLDEEWRGDRRLILVEPRRIAARAAAERMAATLGEKVGQTIGIRSRLDVRVSNATRIEVVTEGVFSRMVLSDPQYGYNVKPENVIGVSLLLKDPRTGSITTARKLISENRYRPADLLDHQLTSTLWAPMPWYEGKQAAIHTYVHPWKKPILVAGDTPESDGPMLFRGAAVEQGALRLFVSRTDAALNRMQAMQSEHADSQHEHGLPVTAHTNWLVVTPEQIQ